MSITIPGRVVVFDYGEVISSIPSRDARAELERLVAPAPPEALWASYWHHRPALDQATMTVEDYWRAIGRDLTADWTDARLHALWSTDFRSWLEVNQDVLDVLVDLRRGGTRMAMLSNAGPDFSSYYRNGMLGQYFEQVFTSGELGVLKPDPAIFTAVLDALGVGPADVVFVDDRAVNVQTAEDLGMTGHVFSTAERLRQFLGGLVTR
jgi:putative hydrolase of the HAD superfamily